jgi:hypothetical protein
MWIYLDESNGVNSIDQIIAVLGAVGTIAGLMLAWVVARRPGTFARTTLKMPLYDLEEGKHAPTEQLVVRTPNITFSRRYWFKLRTRESRLHTALK